MGLTRKLFRGGHNEILARILYCYFLHTGPGKAVSFQDMANFFVRAWNGELHDFFDRINAEDPFISMDAEAFLVIADSFSVLQGTMRLEDSVLLHLRGDLQGRLQRASSWSEL